MNTKDRPSYLGLLDEVNDLYGEYIEMGISVDTFLLSRLHREREKNFDLQRKVDYLEKRLLHDTKKL